MEVSEVISVFVL